MSKSLDYSFRTVLIEFYLLGDIRHAADTSKPEAVASEPNPIITETTLMFAYFFCLFPQTPKPYTEQREHDAIIFTAVAPAAISCFEITHY
jgi:hypothetical protein